MSFTIRRITPADDKAMAAVLLQVYDELGSEGRVPTYTINSDPQVGPQLQQHHKINSTSSSHRSARTTPTMTTNSLS